MSQKAVKIILTRVSYLAIAGQRSFIQRVGKESIKGIHRLIALISFGRVSHQLPDVDTTFLRLRSEFVATIKRKASPGRQKTESFFVWKQCHDSVDNDLVLLCCVYNRYFFFNFT